MIYQDMVTEARGLLQRDKQTRDRLIELTAEAVRQVSQAQWSADIGAHRSTVADWLRYVRETNDLAAAAAPSYDDWYRANRRDESDRGASAVQVMPPERKAELARELLADPAVADAAFNRPDHRLPGSETSQILGNVAGAQIRAEKAKVIDRQSSGTGQTREINRNLSERSAQLALGKACDDFTEAVSRNLPLAGALADGERFWLSGACDRSGVAQAALRDYVESGKADLDAELAKLSGQGGEHRG